MSGDGYGFPGGSEREREVASKLLTRDQPDIRFIVGLEALHSDRDVIGTGGQIGDREFTTCVGDHGLPKYRLLFRDGNGSSGDDRAGGIEDQALNSRGGGLAGDTDGEGTT